MRNKHFGTMTTVVILMLTSCTAMAQKFGRMDSSSSNPWLYYDQGQGYTIAIPDSWDQKDGTWLPKDTSIHNAYISVSKLSGMGTKDMREQIKWLKTTGIFTKIDSSTITRSYGEIWGSGDNGTSYVRDILTPYGLYQIIVYVPEQCANDIKSIIPRLVQSFQAVPERVRPGQSQC